MMRAVADAVGTGTCCDRRRVRGRRRARSAGARARRGCRRWSTGRASPARSSTRSSRTAAVCTRGCRESELADLVARTRARRRELRRRRSADAGRAAACGRPTSSVSAPPCVAAATAQPSSTPSWWRPRSPSSTRRARPQPAGLIRVPVPAPARAPLRSHRCDEQPLAGRCPRPAPPPRSLQRLQLAGGQRRQRRAVRRPPRQHAGDRLEQDRLLGPDRAGRQHRQRVAASPPTTRARRGDRRTPHATARARARAARPGR